MKKQLPNTITGLIILAQMLAVISILLICTIYFFKMTKPKPEFFVHTLSGKNDQIYPLDEPNVSSKALLRWASLAATNAYTLDFVNYKQTLDKLKPFFTKSGFDHFMDALDSTNRLQDIISDKLIVSAVVTSTPILLAEGTIKDVYTWKIQVPLLLNYQGASERSTKQKIVVNMLVIRVPTKEAVTGIGITQMKDVIVTS